ncbi:MAG: hypothetical protein RL111_1901 [Pseudomonadota bacterium]
MGLFEQVPGNGTRHDPQVKHRPSGLDAAESALRGAFLLGSAPAACEQFIEGVGDGLAMLSQVAHTGTELIHGH